MVESRNASILKATLEAASEFLKELEYLSDFKSDRHAAFAYFCLDNGVESITLHPLTDGALEVQQLRQQHLESEWKHDSGAWVLILPQGSSFSSA
eukprot:1537170-Amphidinium_carterae.1